MIITPGGVTKQGKIIPGGTTSGCKKPDWDLYAWKDTKKIQFQNFRV